MFRPPTEETAKTLDMGDFVGELIDTNLYEVTLKGTTKYVTMTGAEIVKKLKVAFAHVLIRAQLLQVTSADALATDPLSILLERPVSSVYPSGFAEMLFYLPQIYTARCHIEINNVYEQANWHLALTGTATNKVYPKFLVQKLSGQIPPLRGGRPQICLNGSWMPACSQFNYSSAVIGQDSTNAYAILERAIWIGDIKKLTVWIKELDTNAIKWRVSVSMDGTNYEVVGAAVTVAKNGSDYHTLTDCWNWLKIEIIDDVAGTHGCAKFILKGEKTE